MFDIKGAAKELLEGCIIKSSSGIDMLTPDGLKNYPGLWTRDFAYMLMYAGELIEPDKSRDCLEYLLNRVDENGWVPDKVDANGVPAYVAGAGAFEALPNLDNGPFLIIAAYTYLKSLCEEPAKEFFLKWEKVLLKGIECLPKNSEYIILNDSPVPHSPYGFTDTVCKTGALAMETLLLWHSIRLLLDLQQKFSEKEEKLIVAKESIEHSFLKTFISDCGMLYAATGICRQIDVWASCYMLAIDFPVPKENKSRIIKWLTDNYESIMYKGQMRHLPAGEYWEKTFLNVEKNTYQNGAFWATPTVWFIEAVKNYDIELANKTLNDVLNYFETNGIYECVYEDDCKLNTYVASATNIYGAAKILNVI